MDMILQAELKEYLNLYNKKTLTFLQLAFLFIYGSKSQTLRSGNLFYIRVQVAKNTYKRQKTMQKVKEK